MLVHHNKSPWGSLINQTLNQKNISDASPKGKEIFKTPDIIRGSDRRLREGEGGRTFFKAII
jgi:hypothetical protein